MQDVYNGVMYDVVKKAVSALENDGVIIHPTDTCYGFAASIFSEKGVARLYDIKQMPETKPIAILVGSLEQAREFGIFNEVAEKLVKKHWPGALTMIVKRSEKLPQHINPGNETIGIRFLHHELTEAIIRELGHPIVTTSANKSGEPEAYSFAMLKVSADFVIDGGALPHVKASTVVDCSQGTAIVIRKGPVDIHI